MKLTKAQKEVVGKMRSGLSLNHFGSIGSLPPSATLKCDTEETKINIRVFHSLRTKNLIKKEAGFGKHSEWGLTQTGRGIEL